MSLADDIATNVRLIILRALVDEVDETLNDTLLVKVIEQFGWRRSRDYVRTQLMFLRDEAGAVTLREAGTVIIATITDAGRNHVERRAVLSGIDRPSRNS